MISVEKLKILTESAKYDVSCSSSGSSRKNTRAGIGNAAIEGICHSFTQDGRCISLLKILLSNFCCYNCEFCVNRTSNDIPRARATPDEICELTMSFYKRNLIEGLFLSSAIDASPDKTMENLYETVYKLRKVYRFNGYIHLKGIPSADKKLILKAGELADRMSFNLELPTEKSLKLLAPQKSKEGILSPMKTMSDEYKNAKKLNFSGFLPAGQTTQMIVGASPETDGHIVRLTQGLYKNFSLKRVYFSSFVQTNPNSKLLPASTVGLLREHRLYQADWLLRFYGFSAEEIVDENENLSVEYDPKCGWALKHPELFPVEVNSAPPEMLVRIPGIGFKSAYKIVAARKYGALDFEALIKMRVVMKRAINFITCKGKFLGTDNPFALKKLLSCAQDGQLTSQLSLFSDTQTSLEVLTGQL